MIKRREFIAGLGGVAAWPVAARAQQGERMRRIGVVQTLLADDPLSRAQLRAFAEALGKFGWIEGRNVKIDYRFGAEDPDRARRYAAELVALAPDAVLAVGAVVTKTLQQASREVPIVFVAASDPVGEGLVATQARPGGNTTGFALSEYGTTAKSLELLKEIAPNVTRSAVIRDPTLTSNAGQFGAMQAVAPQLGVELSTIDVRDSDEIARGIAAFARGPNGGLVVANSAAAIIHRELIITLAARHRLPGGIAKEDLRFFPLRKGFDLRVFLLEPSLDQGLVALLRAVQRLLASDAKLRQQSTNRIGAQRDAKLIQDQLGDHVARPQRERKLQLQRILLCHGLVDPLHSSCIQFGRPSKQRLGFQRSPSTSSILCQPSEYRPATDP
jgi:putative tryptophan/tyrosine transport system substrate-binding protein